jgi:hypothetical protein
LFLSLRLVVVVPVFLPVVSPVMPMVLLAVFWANLIITLIGRVFIIISVSITAHGLSRSCQLW